MRTRARITGSLQLSASSTLTKFQAELRINISSIKLVVHLDFHWIQYLNYILFLNPLKAEITFLIIVLKCYHNQNNENDSYLNN